MNMISKRELLLETLYAYLYNETTKRTGTADIAQKERLEKVLRNHIYSLLDEKDLRDVIVAEQDNTTLTALTEGHFYQPIVQMLEENESKRTIVLNTVLQDSNKFFHFIDFAAQDLEKNAPLLQEIRENDQVKRYAFECMYKVNQNHNEQEDTRRLQNLLDFGLLDLSTWKEPNKYGEEVPVICFSFDSMKFNLASYLYAHPNFQQASNEFLEEANQHILSKLFVRSITAFDGFIMLPEFFPSKDSFQLISKKYQEKDSEKAITISSLLYQHILSDTKHSDQEKAEALLHLEQTFQPPEKPAIFQKSGQN